MSLFVFPPKDFSIFLSVMIKMYVICNLTPLIKVFELSFQKLHQLGFSLGEGSEVKVHQPWISGDDGYTSRVTGKLEAVVVTSDMSYPHLASADSLQVIVTLN